MAPLNPTSNKCYSVSVPTDEKDDRLNLAVRTGAATCLSNSRIFVHGGFTFALNLPEMSTQLLYERLEAKAIELGLDPATVDWSKYISNELFELNILERKWRRLKVSANSPKPRPRIYHTAAFEEGDIYVSGGLVLTDKNTFEPLCDLWKFDSDTDSWLCLCDGSAANKGRFAHTMLYFESSIAFDKIDHQGLLIVGGKTTGDVSVPEFDFFDLVDKKWIGAAKKVLPIEDLRISLPNKTEKTQKKVVTTNCADSSVIIHTSSAQYNDAESMLIAYTRMGENAKSNPLIEFSLDLKSGGKRLPITVDSFSKNLAVPYNLSYCNIGSFGDHILVMGFPQGRQDISISLYHKPSGKWSSLRAFCDHDAFSHKISRGYVWASHHKILLLGDSKMHDSAHSVQYFNHFMTISLPFVNVSGNSNYYTGINSNSTGTDTAAHPQLHHEKSFIEYSRYMAPHVQMTSIKSVFPPYAVTLGRNAFERFGYSMADFEFISADGDSVPIPSMLCRKRWGRCFEMLVAKGYVRAVDNFEKSTVDHEFFTSQEDRADVTDMESSDPSMHHHKPVETPHFRLPFQDTVAAADLATSDSVSSTADSTSLMTPGGARKRESSVTSTSSSIATNTEIIKPPIPAPKPQPSEQAPILPPRAKQTQIRSPSASSSPRGSISGGLQPFSQLDKQKDTTKQESPSRKSRPGSKGSLAVSLSRDDSSSAGQSRSIGSMANISLVSNKPSTKFVEQQLDGNSSKMESLLLPRAIYLPFATSTVKALAEFLSTGQVGSKWPIVPTTLDIILISKFYELPLLYDLVLETLYSIIGNKENQLIADANQLSAQFVAAMTREGEAYAEPPNLSCLNGFADFLSKFNDGVLDLKILKKISKSRKESIDAGRRKRSQDSGSSSGSSKLKEFSSIPSKSPSTSATPAAASAVKADEEEEEIEEGDPRYKGDLKVKPEGESDHDNSTDSSSDGLGIGIGIGLVSQIPTSLEADSEIAPKEEATQKRQSQATESIPLKKHSASSSSYRNNSTGYTDNSWPTLGQLTAVNAPACTDLILDCIYEIGALAGDMKLSVRAANALEISQKYEVEKREVLRQIDPNIESPASAPRLPHQLSQTLNKPRSIFGKLDLGNSTGNVFEKRGSISSILSNADSNYSSDPTASRYPPPLNHQQSSNTLERVNTFDSSKSVSGAGTRSNSGKIENLKKNANDNSVSPSLTIDSTADSVAATAAASEVSSTNSSTSKLQANMGNIKLGGFLKRK